MKEKMIVTRSRFKRLVGFALWLTLTIGNFGLGAMFALRARDTGDVLPNALKCLFHLGVYAFLCGSKPNEKDQRQERSDK